MQRHQNFPKFIPASFRRVEGSRKPRPSWQVVTRLKARGGILMDQDGLQWQLLLTRT